MDCDDFLEKFGKELGQLKEQNTLYEAKKINSQAFETKMQELLNNMKSDITTIKHIYAPLEVPNYLQISRLPPKWIKLTSEQTKQFSKIAEENENAQKDLYMRFRRPGLRLATVNRASTLLLAAQRKTKNENQFRQYNDLLNILISQIRTRIVPGGNVENERLANKITKFVKENDIDEPYDNDSLSMFVLSIFGGEGLFKHKSKDKSPIDMILEIASGIVTAYPKTSINRIISVIRPLVADLYHDKLMIKHPLEPVFQEAITVIGESITLEDFGITEEMNSVVNDDINSFAKNQGVEDIAEKFIQTVLDAREMQEDPSIAAKMIAVAIIQEKQICILSYFNLVLQWCSDERIKNFEEASVFVEAFSLIFELMQPLNS